MSLSFFFFFLYSTLLSRIQVLGKSYKKKVLNNFFFSFLNNKGVLASSHNKYVVVKKPDNMVREVEMEFKNEVIVIGQKMANLKNIKKKNDKK